MYVLGLSIEVRVLPADHRKMRSLWSWTPEQRIVLLPERPAFLKL